MVEDGIIGTCGGRDCVASVALFNGVCGLTIFGGESAETEDSADGEVCAALVVFAGVESCELEPG